MDVHAVAEPLAAVMLAATAARAGARRMAPSTDADVAQLRQDFAVHEVNNESQFRVINLKMTAILAVQGIILIMLAGGSPVAAAIRAAFGG